MSSSRGACYELFIRPLPSSVSDRALHGALTDLFGRFGEITHAKIRCDSVHTFAFVQFRDEFAALQAIYEVHGNLLFGTKLSVSWSGDSLKSFVTRYIVRVEQHPWKIDKARMIELFARYGPTLVDCVPKATKAFAYVRFAHAEAAQRAIDELDGIDFDGVEVSVCWDAASPRPGAELIVRFLPFDVSKRTIRDLFGEHGSLTNVHIPYDRTSGHKDGDAFVRFLRGSDAERAMDALDGHAMTRGPIRVAWTTASKPSGHVIRVLDLPAAADRKMLKKIFSRCEGLRRVEVDYDRSGRSNQMGYLTFANREQAQAVVKEFDGRFLRDDQGVIRVPADRLKSELEREASAETAPFPSQSDSASQGTAIPDLLTDSVDHVTASVEPVDPPVDLIDFSDPAPTSLPSVAISPVEVGYIYAEKRQYEIPIHFYAVPETEKLATATQILLDGFYAAEDLNNNKSDQRNTKVTLVVRGMQELVAAMGRINAGGMDCWMSDDPSIRGGHAFHPSEWTTVNVSMAPVCNKIKYSRHVVFLSPIDDPEDVGAAMDVMMLERTDVNLVSVLLDEDDDDQRHQVSLMLNLLR